MLSSRRWRNLWGSNATPRVYLPIWLRRGGDVAAQRARAQRQALPVIGFLNVGTRSDSDMALPGLRQGLREAGFIEG